MHLEFLVEEQSAEAALGNLVPKLVGQTVSFTVHAFSGKDALLRKLPARLRGYRHWLPDDHRIIVLVDADQADCRELKQKLERIAHDAGFATLSTPGPSLAFHVVNRLAIEELEAWFFGDVDAVVKAYPGVSPDLARKRGFRDPDAIKGGTWEQLERVLQDAGHHRGGLAKVRAARDITAHMAPERNRSRSFQVFRAGVQAAVS